MIDDGNKNIYLDDQGVNLKYFLNFIKRNKLIIGSFGFFGVFIGGILSLTLPKIWQGEFQIVLSDDTNNTNFTSTVAMDLAKIKSGNKQLQTEVEILSSPSVLMNVFKYVKQQKINSDKSSKDLRFDSWKKDLKIELKKGTSVLNLKYKDEDKTIIKPVLDKISLIYKNYSNKKRVKSISNTLDFLEREINIYKIKSDESARELQDFSIKNNLVMVDFSSSKNNKKPEFQNKILQDRIKASSNLQLINEQIKEVEKFDSESEEIIGFANNILTQYEFDSKTLNVLNDLNLILADYRNKYLPNSSEIQLLEAKKKSFLIALKDETIGYLKASRVNLKALINALERPQEILLKYRKLINSSSNNILTLRELEKEFITLSLDKNRKSDPWELITEPTILPYPIAPDKKKIIALSLMLSTIIGFLTPFLIEIKNKKVFLNDELEKLLNTKLILDINKNKDLIQNLFKYLESNFLIQSKNDLVFTFLGNTNQNLFNNFFEQINKSQETTINISPINDLNNLTSYKNIIICIELGKVTSYEIGNFNQLIKYSDLNLIGFVSCSENN